MAKLKKILFCPDVHAPFEDKRAFDLFLKVAKSWRPDRIEILGDFADFYGASFHSRDPLRKTRLPEEIKYTNKLLDRIEALGADVDFHEGNHCWRATRYLHDKAPDLVGLPGLTVPEFFRIKERGWSFVPYRSHSKVGKIFVTHDCGPSGEQAAAQSRNKFQGNVVIGHCHRLQVSYRGSARGESHVGVSAGWLGDLRKIDYAHKVQAAEWQLGFATAHLEENGNAHIQAVPIVNYRCVVDGVLYQ